MIVHKHDVIALMMIQMRISKNRVYDYLRHPEFPMPVRKLGRYEAFELDRVCGFLGITEDDAIRIISATQVQPAQAQTA